MPDKTQHLPAYVRRRIELAKLFDTSSQTEKRRWGRLFASNFEHIQQRFEVFAGENNYQQKVVSEDTLIWYEPKKSDAECMITFVQDVMNLNHIERIFRRIKEYNPFFSYAIVHQIKDGDGVYDIFRFSRFSFLEHHNRVKAPKQKETNRV